MFQIYNHLPRRKTHILYFWFTTVSCIILVNYLYLLVEKFFCKILETLIFHLCFF